MERRRESEVDRSVEKLRLAVGKDSEFVGFMIVNLKWWKWFASYGV